MKLTNDERLALLVATDKQLKPLLDEAKAQKKNELLDLFEMGGADRTAILVGETKVGECGMSYSTAKPVIFADKESEALDFLRELELTEEKPKSGWEDAFTVAGDTVVCKETGEPVDWATWEPSRIKGTAVRIKDTQKVLDAFGSRLEGANPLALLGE